MSDIVKQAFAHANRLLKEGDFSQAQEILENILDQNPEQYEALLNLGIAYAQNNKLDLAIPLFHKVAQVHPKNLGALYNLGLAYSLQ